MEGGTLRWANVGRAALASALNLVVTGWMYGVHWRGMVIGGAGMFLAMLVVFEGGDRWDAHRNRPTPGPPPPLPTSGRAYERPGSADAGWPSTDR